jgi:hypothetical protein
MMETMEDGSGGFSTPKQVPAVGYSMTWDRVGGVGRGVDREAHRVCPRASMTGTVPSCLIWHPVGHIIILEVLNGFSKNRNHYG